jgi:calpain
MNKNQSQRPNNKETFYHEVRKSNNENQTGPQQTDDVVDSPLNYRGFEKIYMLGEKGSGSQSRKTLQNYAKLQEYYLRNKTLFIDNAFPPDTSLKLPDGKVVWKRPFEISEHAEFITNGATRNDIDQGKLGDCWFLAAVANLTLNQKLFSIVVPTDQSFSQNYAGIFHFRFWQYGRWIDIVIDDRLPTINNKLVYLRSTDPNEFWPSLLEKAYAKLYGSYQNLEGGQICEALEDLCGGLSEFYSATQPEVFEIMETSFKKSSFMGCSIVSSEKEGTRDDGLITTHAYSVTGVETIKTGDSEIRLIRVRNPWGNSAEWNGSWSDNSESWNLVPKEVSDKLRVKRYDGEFWMEVEDFKKCFTFLDICHLNPSTFCYENEDSNWYVSMFESSWIPNVTAGGGYKYQETFANNPQYLVTVKGNNTPCTLVIGLMQKNRRLIGGNDLPLEINIFKVETDPGHLLDKDFFKSREPVLHNTEVGVRQLTIRALLPPGRYCIIPSTGFPNKYASYLLRIYSSTKTNVVENDEDIGYSKDAMFTQPNTTEEVNDSGLLRIFRSVAGNQTEIGWYSIRKALNSKYGKRRLFCFIKPKILFSKSTCQNIVSLWDANYSGKLDFEEFGHLMQDVEALKATFVKFDKDNSGKLDGFELRNLLTACGYKVDRKILGIIMIRYGSHGSITFENFVLCIFKLKTMIDEFQRRQTIDTNDQINVNQRDWLETTLYS